MKKFYKQAETGTAPGGFTVRLDGKNIKTPLLHPLILPNAQLADAIAAEWNAQGAEVVPATMPVTQLANTMIDKAQGHERPEMEKDIVRFAGSDLVCYFGTHPADLVARQEKCWRPLLSWLAEAEGVTLESISGIRYMNQPEQSVKAIAQIVSTLNAADFTVVQALTGLCGSVVIALAALRGRISAGEAYEAAAVDEIYQLEKWGEDTLARRKLDHLKSEIDAIFLFRDLVTASASDAA